MPNQISLSDCYDPDSRKLILRGVESITREVLDFASRHLVEILDASGGTLSSLPADFGRLNRLKIAFFSDNHFKVTPRVLADCPALEMVAFKNCGLSEIPEDSLPVTTRWAMFTGNPDLKTLPASMGKLTEMRKLALAGCGLSSLPPEMEGCRNIELLRISANNFTAPPPNWLFNLPRLAWYSDAGNPFCAAYTPQEPLIAEIPWDSIILGKSINRSPSSEVFRAIKKGGDQEEVAIKLFHAGLTSDGYPEDDRRAFLAAGKHPNLIEIQGKLTGHPSGKQGLVMTLIPSNYYKLGLPPNFDTCTRDAYPSDASFSLKYIFNVSRGLASVFKNLHEKGIEHGDIYAHNTLANGAGDPCAGDFGAASFYGRDEGKKRERLDVRAFGCLMDDLLQRQQESSSNGHELEEWRNACMNETLSKRPSFDDIFDALRLA